MMVTASESSSFAEYGKVVEAIRAYIDCARPGDGDSIVKAFYDHARVHGTRNGDYCALDMPTFREAVKEMGPSPNVRHHVAWVDISGPAAAAKLEIHDWAGYRFTDYFVLYKNEDGWKISGKVYNAHSQNYL